MQFWFPMFGHHLIFSPMFLRKNTHFLPYTFKNTSNQSSFLELHLIWQIHLVTGVKFKTHEQTPTGTLLSPTFFCPNFSFVFLIEN